MKLLDEFQRQLDKTGPPRRVFLTTFNMGIELVETHLLPAILGMETPRSAMEFEQMQQELALRQAAADNAETDGDAAPPPLDLRVFADRRMLFNSVERKRTSLPVSPVSPLRLGFGTASLFHPKVIYIEGAEGAILGCGSANLSVGGWANNQEVFVFRKISSAAQAAQVQAFFAPLLTAAGQPETALGARLWGDDAGWSFCHSFQPAGLLPQLAAHQPPGTPMEGLGVWSPYFSDDLAHMLDAVRRQAGHPGMPVSVVADRNETGQIRTRWSGGLAEQLQEGRLAFHAGSRQVRRDERIKMSHAKVWLTPHAIAIGSWNCSMPGAQLQGRDNNIEAGMLLPDPPDFKSALGDAIPVDEGHFCSPAQLLEDELQLPPLPPFDLAVSFDWRTLNYSVRLDWPDDCSAPDYVLHLPDLPGIPLQPGMPAQAHYPVAEPQRILTNRYYTVELNGGTVARGIVNEQHAQLRRGERFASLDDLLEALVLGFDSASCPATELRGTATLDLDAADAADLEPPSNAALSSYFRLFNAFDQFRSLIAKCDSAVSLHICVLARPGCVKELHEKIQQHPEGGNAIYHWFLVQEFNTLLLAAQQKAAALGAGLPLDLDRLRLATAAPDGNAARYMELIRKECSYA